MSFAVIVVGLGQIGMGYDINLDPDAFIMTHARAFSLHPDFILCAGVDTDPLLRNKFEKIYKCPAYSSIEQAFKNHTADVSVIALPTPSHSHALDEILQYSQPKLVLCEKPLAEDVIIAKKMVQACADKNVLFYINYMRRSDSGIIEVKNRIDNGQISSPLKGVVWYTKGWLHNGSHFFNLLEYWLGKVMSSMVLNSVQKNVEGYPDIDVRVSFERGEITFLAASEKYYSHSGIELFCPNGRLRYGSDFKNINWQNVEQDSRFKGYNILSKKSEEILTNMEKYQFQVTEQLALALNGKQGHLCSGSEALYTLEMMTKILELAK